MFVGARRPRVPRVRVGMSCLPCLSARAASADGRAYGESPAGHPESPVRRANTEVILRPDAEEDADDAVLRRAQTELPPLRHSGHSDDLAAILADAASPVRVRFTSEIASVNALARWKKSASAVTFATRALRRSDSRIAGLIQRQHELETGASGDAELAGRAAGVALLESRLAKMRLRTERMGDDGNCQFRALSHNLFGSQDHHAAVRERCVDRISRRSDEYSFLFESDAEFRAYVRDMRRNRTWGDELTLRACADAFGVRIHVVQSTKENWNLVYEPGEEADADGGSKRLFLSYISPVHYNAIVPADRR